MKQATSIGTYLLLVPAVALFAGAALAAEPPSLLNYQGVLRDSSDEPLDGTYDVVFSFFSAEVGGLEILKDFHDSINGNPVGVSGGLLSVALGGGVVQDGSGAGTYTSLASVFRDYADVWLSVEVEGEVLTPRVRVLAAGYALNASHLDGKDSTLFLDTSSTTQTKVGRLVVDASAIATSWGVEGYGTTGGAYFNDSNQSGYSRVGYNDTGIEGYGNAAGGYFQDLDSTAYTQVASNDYGILAYGRVAGGYFENVTGTGHAFLGYSGNGVEGYGNNAGGYFKELDGSGYAFLGFFDDGITAGGNNGGGFFIDLNSSGFANVAFGDYGIQGYGNLMGGYFKDYDHSGYSRVGYGDTGIEGYGNATGGYFQDLNSSGWAQVGNSTYKINGVGTVSFVQNHPERSDQVIVYHAPEASEVAVYARGSARLSGGIARVALDPTFALVANPDLGLTAHVTPRGACSLYVESVSTRELTVRCDDGVGSDLAFDYIVWGLRIGFEELPPVQPKQREARIPSMKDHRDLYAAQPELRSHNALERFKTIEADLRGLDSVDAVDLTASRALIAKIEEFDPAVHTIEEAQPVDRASHASARPEITERSVGEVASTPSSGSPSPHSDTQIAITSDAGVAAETKPATTAVTCVTMTLSHPAEPGEVLSLDQERPGLLRPATSIADAGVVGVAAGPSTPRQEEGVWEALVATSGVVDVRADAGYGAIRPGDLLASSPTAGHAMRAAEVLPGTLLGKALDALETGTGTIRIIVLLR